MKIEVDLKKNYFLTLLAVLIVLSGALFVYAYNSNPGNPGTFGHSANELEVNIGGTLYKLQDAIDAHLIGGAASTISFYAGTVASGTATYTLNIGKHSFCAMSFSSNADDQQQWATGICNIQKNTEGNWTISTSATNGYYGCSAVCVDSASISNTLSQKNCRWQNAVKPSDTIECNSDEFMAGIKFESAWVDAIDNHIAPEVYTIKCCKIG